jgi:hypothetical protein
MGHSCCAFAVHERASVISQYDGRASTNPESASQLATVANALAGAAFRLEMLDV